MPFSKRRRGRGKKGYSGQTLVVPLCQQMPPPACLIGDGQGGFTDADVMTIPSPNNADFEVNGNTFAESPVSQFLGSYRFDFSRLFAHTLGQSNTTNPVSAPLASYFKRVKFHTGYMTIERVDTGITPRLITNSYVVPGGFPNAGETYPLAAAYADAKPIPLDIYYLRLSAHEPTFSQVAISPPLMRADPRTRRVRLMPGKSITFKFHPQKFVPAQYLASTLRSWGVGEQDQFRRAELPSRVKRLGWMPSSIVSRQRPLIPFPSNDSQGGLGADVFPIVSKTILFHFDFPQSGFVNVGNGGTQGMHGLWVGAADTPATNVSRNVLLRRREFCAVSMAGFTPPIQETGGAYVGAPAVGQIIQTGQWNTGAGAYKTMECFDPPHIRSILSQAATGINYGLWRPNGAFSTSNFVPTDVPFDMEQAALPSVDPPNVPIPANVP